MVPSENSDDPGAGTRSCVVTLTVQRLAIAAPMGVGSTGSVIVETRDNLESVEACEASCTARAKRVSSKYCIVVSTRGLTVSHTALSWLSTV